MNNKFVLDKTFVSGYKRKKPKFGFNGLGELTFYRTYSRLKPDGTNEDWTDCVERVVNGTYSIQKRHINKYGLGWDEMKGQESAKEMFDRIWNFKFTPPGRGLWAMGTDIVEKRGLFAALNNCAFTTTANIDVETSRPFEFLMDMSMLGVGVGFDVEGAGKLIIGLPNGFIEYTVPDTREGWVESVRLLINAYLLKGPMPKFDYSEIRPFGTPIKTFGGKASGYEPLKKLHEDIQSVFENSMGQLISATNITDIMNHIGVCVVAGNVRRTAEIVFGPPTEEYMDLKNYEKNPHRAAYGWTSNNSIFAEIGMDYGPAADRTALNGEPGYEWLQNARMYSRMKDEPDLKDVRAMGGNPCVTGDTWVMTSKGLRQVSDLIGNEIPIVVDGKVYPMISKGFWKTGDKEVYRLKFSDGRFLRVTADHKIKTPNGWVEASDLEIGAKVVVSNNQSFKWEGGRGTFDDGYVCGMFIGDGSFQSGRATLCTWARDHGAEAIRNYLSESQSTKSDSPTFKGWGGPFGNGWFRLSNKSVSDLVREWYIFKGNKNITPELEKEASYNFVRGLLRGLFDSDGSVQGDQKKGVSIRINQANLELLQSVQRLLGAMGINSTIYHRSDAQMRSMPNGKDGYAEYMCNEMWELVISKSNIQTFADLIGFTHSEKAFRLETLLASYKRNLNSEQFVSTLVSMEYEGKEEVYDVTVESVHAFDANGIIVHNCLEQTLEDKELCCLVETFPIHHDSLEDYEKTLKYAYLYAKTVTLGNTHWVETNRVMMRNRRIGLSQSGIAMFIERRGIDEYKSWCESGYEAVQYWDSVYSEWLAVPKSIKTTSVKPSGTVSLLAGVTPGMHFPENHYYIRRIRVAKGSHLVGICERAGYKVEPDVYDASSMVVEIPVGGMDDIRTVDQVSMWEQVALSAFIHKYWADNQVSCTVTFKPEEAGQIKHALNYFQYELKGISFLPKTEAGAYAQMPYEAISKERYEELLKDVKPMVFDTLGEDSAAEKFCNNDSCEI